MGVHSDYFLNQNLIYQLKKITKNRENKIDPCGKPKETEKIKLEDVIAIFTSSLFLAEVTNILYRI